MGTVLVICLCISAFTAASKLFEYVSDSVFDDTDAVIKVTSPYYA
jgi:hypothetical protein